MCLSFFQVLSEAPFHQDPNDKQINHSVHGWKYIDALVALLFLSRLATGIGSITQAERVSILYRDEKTAKALMDTNKQNTVRSTA
jgi:hypothetical protein